MKVNRVELQDINPPEDIRQAIEKQMGAERDRRANILEAEATIKKANAEAEAIRKVTDAITTKAGDPVNYIIAVRYVDTLKEMVTGKDNKVIYLPYEATGILSSIGGIKDMLEQSKKA